MTDQPPAQLWVVVVPQGSWTKAYGTFDDYEALIAWVKAQGWDVPDVNIHPLNEPKS